MCVGTTASEPPGCSVRDDADERVCGECDGGVFCECEDEVDDDAIGGERVDVAGATGFDGGGDGGGGLFLVVDYCLLAGDHREVDEGASEFESEEADPASWSRTVVE